jgi:pyruvate dehydrogenase E2 component (dihydrolipoamide acetyltransferase)
MEKKSYFWFFLIQSTNFYTMAEVIRMPRLSDTMEEGVIIEWMKKVGDEVNPGDILAEVETDKATMDLESFNKGILLHIAVPKGTIAVDGIIAIIGKKGEDVDAILAEAENESNSEEEEVSSEEAPQAKQTVVNEAAKESGSNQSQTSPGDRIKASPLARKIADEAGIPLEKVNGTGENGRIVKRDIESALEQGITSTSAAVFPSSGHEDFQVSQMRKTIARRLGESKFTAPHFYLTMKIDMTEAINARKQINAMIEPNKISFNDLVVKACAVALKKHPEVNSSWLGDRIRRNFDVHIGVAVAVEDGLMVPVIQHADQKSLTALGQEVKDKAGRARSKKLNLDEMQGNTFTISNLGMYGIDEFTAIINPPDACILAVGGIEKKPVVINDAIEIRSIMKVTLSCDHRAVDGAMGSQFLLTLKALLEAPVRILA